MKGNGDVLLMKQTQSVRGAVLSLRDYAQPEWLNAVKAQYTVILSASP